MYPYNLDQLEVVADIRSDPYAGVEVLKRSHRVNASTDVLVSPANVIRMLAFADTLGIPVEFKHDYGRFIEPQSQSNLRSFEQFDYNSYNTILDHIDFIAQDVPELVKVQDLGSSSEGRKILLVKISTNHSARKPILFIEGGIHGRDWVGIAMAMYLIDFFSLHPDCLELVDVDWYILPVVNPDGYEYTRSKRSRRLWRKTRSLSEITHCEGVDANRNLKYKWGTGRVSHDPCDPEIYCGTMPFSEPETQALRIALLENARNIKAYFSMHTYGQYMMYPWAYTDEVYPAKAMRLSNLAQIASDALVSAGGMPLEVTSIGRVDMSSGTSADYAYGVLEIPYVYVLQLTEGFEYFFPKQLLSKVLPQYYQAFRIVSIQLNVEFGEKKWCKTFRTCYKDMLDALQGKDEEACIEDASVGASTMTVYFKALTQFCGQYINVTSDRVTFEGRHLYEVVVHYPREKKDGEVTPVIMVDAGQEAGAESVGLALFLIEQLVACKENFDMVSRVKWVILPCTNPDGLEYTRFDRPLWRKNTKMLEEGLCYGVDISRNFDTQWDACDKVTNGFSPIYPGIGPSSENETRFIKSVLLKYKNDMKAYLSIRRDGHAILYPYAFKENKRTHQSLMSVAADIAAKVNQRGGGVQTFVDDSIYDANGKPRCGHSVDYAFEQGVPLAFEMRVFHSDDLDILSKFQNLPKGYQSSLRNSYFNGIKELYYAVGNPKRKG